MLLIICILPVSAMSAPSDFTFTADVSPPTVGTLGGEATVNIEVTNTGSSNITEISVYIGYLGDSIYDSDCCGETWFGSLAPGASVTLTPFVDFEAGFIDKDLTIRVAINNDLDPAEDEHHNGPLKIAGEENIIKSNGGNDPQKDIYFPGDTVLITDNMRNSLETSATDFDIRYYFKKSGGATTNADAVVLGTVLGGETKEYSFSYTFTEDDIGELRIGSQITYHIAGYGPYSEYNVAHDFVIKPLPTAPPTPEPTSEPTPIATEETQTDKQDTPLKSQSDKEEEDISENVSEESGQISQTKEQNHKLIDNPLIVAALILGILLIITIIILIIVVIAKKSGNNDDFS